MAVLARHGQVVPATEHGRRTFGGTAGDCSARQGVPANVSVRNVSIGRYARQPVPLFGEDCVLRQRLAVVAVGEYPDQLTILQCIGNDEFVELGYTLAGQRQSKHAVRIRDSKAQTVTRAERS